MSKRYHCGVNRFMPKWVRRILSYKFNEACFVHDVDHNSGMDMKLADRRFYEHMQEIAGTNPFLQAQALAYYTAVRIFSNYKTWKTTKQR